MPDATYNLILDDVEDLATVALPTWTIAVRDNLLVLPGEEQDLPLLVFLPIYQASVEEAFEEQVCIAHQVGVGAIWEGNRTFTRDRTIINSLATIRETLHVPTLTTATKVWDCDIDLNPTFDVSQIPANCRFSIMKLTYKSWEARNG